MPEIVIPWRGGCPHRARALTWVRGRHGLPVTIAEATAGPWSKASAVMPAIASSTADVVVVADADVWTDGLAAAIDAIRGGAAWAMPQGRVHRLTETATAAVLGGAGWEEQELDQEPYFCIEGGGIIVARRETLLQVPLDPRFRGWGQEDESWAMALRTLHGAPWRGSSPLVHLYHPSQPRLSRRHGSNESWALRRRYVRARHHPDQMRALLAEATDALNAHQPPGGHMVPDRVG